MKRVFYSFNLDQYLHDATGLIKFLGDIFLTHIPLHFTRVFIALFETLTLVQLWFIEIEHLNGTEVK